MNDRKQLSQTAFDRQAASYDADQNGAHARTLYPHIAKKLAALSFTTLLDVGCGTGEILHTAAQLYPNAMLYGIDISAAMLQKAAEKLPPTVQLTQGDAEHLPYADNSFDLLICSDSFHHYPQPQQAMHEFFRVLQPGGTLLLTDFWRPFPIRQLMNLFISFSSEGDVRVYSQQEITHFLQSAGFGKICYQNINRSAYLATANK